MDAKVLPIVIIVMEITQHKEQEQKHNPDVCAEAVGLLITYRCNLKCRYCYIQKKRNVDMSLDMAKSILEPFLLKQDGMLNIAVMGGETLLALDVIMPLVEWVKKGKWNRKHRFFGSTNGTLLNEELKKWLRENRNLLTLGLSYDGTPSAQVSNRGNNDIDIDFFIDTWPKQPIQMTINAETVSQMAQGIQFLLEKGAYVHPNVAFENYEWSDVHIREYGRQLNRMIHYYRKNPKKHMISQFIHDLNEYADAVNNHNHQTEMCGAGNGFQVFDVDGVAYPCHILSPLVMKGDKFNKMKTLTSYASIDFEDPDCSFCPYTSSCPTCIACNYLYRGDLKKRDKTHCRIMKTEVRACIKKEVVRLKNKQILSSEDASIIDSIKILTEYEKMRK